MRISIGRKIQASFLTVAALVVLASGGGIIVADQIADRGELILSEKVPWK